MSDPERQTLDPAILAENAAIEVFKSPHVTERNNDDTTRLVSLDQAAAAFNFVDQSYWVEASRGISLPVTFDREEPVRMIDFFKVDFEGTFLCYSKVVVGRILGRAGVSSVSALCLTFHKATLLPYLEKLPKRHLLYVPVLAVDEIEPTKALS